MALVNRHVFEGLSFFESSGSQLLKYVALGDELRRVAADAAVEVGVEAVPDNFSVAWVVFDGHVNMPAISLKVEFMVGGNGIFTAQNAWDFGEAVKANLLKALLESTMLRPGEFDVRAIPQHDASYVSAVKPPPAPK